MLSDTPNNASLGRNQMSRLAPREEAHLASARWLPWRLQHAHISILSESEPLFPPCFRKNWQGDTQHGGMGVPPESLSGAVLSGRYVTRLAPLVGAEFCPDWQVVRDFLGFLTSQLKFAQQVENCRAAGELACRSAVENDIVDRLKMAVRGRRISD